MTNKTEKYLREGEVVTEGRSYPANDPLTGIAPAEWHVDGDQGWHLKELPITDESDKPLKGDWTIVCDETFKWKSNPVSNPTTVDIRAKVDAFLRDTGDSHPFIEVLYHNMDSREITVGLGS